MTGMGWSKVRFLVWRRRSRGPDVPLWLSDGRIPRDQLVAAGLGPRPLRDAAGAPLDRHAAEAEAERLNALLDRWRRGELTETGAAYATADTIARVLDRFFAHKAFTGKAAGTRIQYRGELQRLIPDFGDQPLRALSRANVEKHIELRPTPATRRAALAAIRRFLTWCQSQKLLKSHPLKGENALALDDEPIHGRIVIWNRHVRDRMLAWADAIGLPAVGDATVLGRFYGLRRGDVLARVWPPRHQRDLRVTPSKVRRWGRAPLVLPLRDTGVAALDARLSAMEARQTRRTPEGAVPLLAGQPMIQTAAGKRYQPRAFWEDFSTVRTAAAFGDMLALMGHLVTRPNTPIDPALLDTTWSDVRFADLRDTCVTELWDAGCTIEQICSITGHTPSRVDVILRHYLQHTGVTARAAFAKRGRAEA